MKAYREDRMVHRFHPNVVRSALAVAAEVLTTDDGARFECEVTADPAPVRVGAEDATGRIAARSR